MKNSKPLNIKKYSAIYSLLFNGIIMVLMFVLIGVSYEINDDVALAQHIANGYYLYPFCNYLLTRTLGFIQELIYPLNTYTIVTLILSWLSISTITKIFIEKFDWKIGSIFTLFINAIFGVSYFTTISFTRNSAIMVSAGLLAVIYYSEQKKWILGTIWGIVLTIIGGMYRFAMLESVFIIAVALVGAVSFKNFFDLSKVERKFSKLLKIVFEPKRLICAVLILVVSFSLNTINQKIYNSDEEFSSYYEYTTARSKAWDYKTAPYSECKDEYDKIGVSENDLAILSVGLVDKDNGLTLEQLKGISQISDNYYKTDKNPISLFKQGIDLGLTLLYSHDLECVSIISVIGIFLIYLVIQKKPRLLPIIFIGCVDVVSFCYIAYLGRTKYRALVGIFIFSMASVLYLIDYNKIRISIKENKIVKTISILLSMIIAITGFYFINQKNENMVFKLPNDNMVSMVHQFEEQTDNKYIFFVGDSITWSEDVDTRDAFHVKKLDSDKNYICQTHVYYASPFYKETLKNFGTDNLYKELLNDNIYAVLNNDGFYKNNVNYIQKHLQNYYSNGKTVKVEKIKAYKYYTVYKYYLAN